MASYKQLQLLIAHLNNFITETMPMSLMSADAYAKWRMTPPAGERSLSSSQNTKRTFIKFLSTIHHFITFYGILIVLDTSPLPPHGLYIPQTKRDKDIFVWNLQAFF
jgi:hypothetical protein